MEDGGRPTGRLDDSSTNEQHKSRHSLCSLEPSPRFAGPPSPAPAGEGLAGRGRIASRWLETSGNRISSWPGYVICFLIQLYRWTLSPALVFLFGANSGCRFTPTCSQYAREAIERHGALAGSALAVKRICRCHPLGRCGHDPVPLGREDLARPHPGPLPQEREKLSSDGLKRRTITSIHSSDWHPVLEGKASHG